MANTISASFPVEKFHVIGRTSTCAITRPNASSPSQMWALNHDIIVALEPSWTRRDRLRNVYRNVSPDTITTNTPSRVMSQNAPRPDEPPPSWMTLIIP